MRRTAVPLLLAFGFALAGCAMGPGYQSQAYSGSSYPPGYGYASPGTQTSSCGAIGTCAVGEIPSLGSQDEHSY